ncbi:MAG: hypothetical protein GXP09_01645 [Gammaproteobacteria bacterium]|nr:hypothetical protein [Gammaproteobacteria bacterium]
MTRRAAPQQIANRVLSFSFLTLLNDVSDSEIQSPLGHAETGDGHGTIGARPRMAIERPAAGHLLRLSHCPGRGVLDKPGKGKASSIGTPQPFRYTLRKSQRE